MMKEREGRGLGNHTYRIVLGAVWQLFFYIVLIEWWSVACAEPVERKPKSKGSQFFVYRQSVYKGRFGSACFYFIFSYS